MSCELGVVSCELFFVSFVKNLCALCGKKIAFLTTKFTKDDTKDTKQSLILPDVPYIRRLSKLRPCRTLLLARQSQFDRSHTLAARILAVVLLMITTVLSVMTAVLLIIAAVLPVLAAVLPVMTAVYPVLAAVHHKNSRLFQMNSSSRVVITPLRLVCDTIACGDITTSFGCDTIACGDITASFGMRYYRVWCFHHFVWCFYVSKSEIFEKNPHHSPLIPCSLLPVPCSLSPIPYPLFPFSAYESFSEFHPVPHRSGWCR